MVLPKKFYWSLALVRAALHVTYMSSLAIELTIILIEQTDCYCNNNIIAHISYECRIKYNADNNSWNYNKVSNTLV